MIRHYLALRYASVKKKGNTTIFKTIFTTLRYMARQLILLKN